jgi:cell division GTPase FtsZ
MQEKRLAIIGLGNAGGNVVKLYGEKFPHTADLILINTSSTDMSKFPQGSYDYSIRMGDFDGTGGHHEAAKRIAMKLMNDKIVNDANLHKYLDGKQFVFIVGSAAGGTGSGMLPVMYQVFSKVIGLGEKVIAVSILPEEGLTVDRIDNTLLNQSELYTDQEATYMIYDNSQFDIKSSFELKARINAEIVEDLAVFTGKDIYPSEYNNIDGEDLLAMMSPPGRIVIVRCDTQRSINHKDIEERILSDLKKTAHAILNEDRIVDTYGLIANLSADSIEGLDESLPKIREKIGEPVSTFMNLSSKESINKVVFVMSGLAKPNDRLFQLHELLVEKKAKIKTDETVFEYRDGDLSTRRRHRQSPGAEPGKDEKIKLSEIFKNLQ